MEDGNKVREDREREKGVVNIEILRGRIKEDVRIGLPRQHEVMKGD